MNMQSHKDIIKRVSYLESNSSMDRPRLRIINPHLIRHFQNRVQSQTRQRRSIYSTFDSDDRERPSNYYSNKEKAQEFTKFNAIKNILVEDLRRTYTQ